jgi:hypothetical protein
MRGVPLATLDEMSNPNYGSMKSLNEVISRSSSIYMSSAFVATLISVAITLVTPATCEWYCITFLPVCFIAGQWTLQLCWWKRRLLLLLLGPSLPKAYTSEAHLFPLVSCFLTWKLQRVKPNPRPSRASGEWERCFCCLCSLVRDGAWGKLLIFRCNIRC